MRLESTPDRLHSVVNTQLKCGVASYDVVTRLPQDLFVIILPVVACAAGGIETHTFKRWTGGRRAREHLTYRLPGNPSTQIPKSPVDAGKRDVFTPITSHKLRYDLRVQRITTNQVSG